MRNPKVLGSFPHGFHMNFVTFFYSIYKHDAIDIADPSSMQDACHMNFVIALAHRRW